MEENFGRKILEDDTLNPLGLKALRNGYPDTGNGVYSERLSYKQKFCYPATKLKGLYP